MNLHLSFRIELLWIRVLVILFIFQSSKLKAQTEPFLFEDQLIYTLENERLRSNAVIVSAGKAFSWQQFDDNSYSSFDSLQVEFNADSIHWSFVIDSTPFKVSMPNEISLLMGGDRGQLQDFLLERLINESSHNEFQITDTTLVDTLWHRSALRYEVLQHIYVSDSLDSTLVCNSSFPIASAINSINDSKECNGLYLVSLIFNRYGYKRDTVQTNIASIMRITGAVDWEKWFAVEGKEITVMLQHPYFAFDHMLFLKLQDGAEKNYWSGEMHSFIPAHNLGELYGKYSKKEGAERFEIK